MDFNYRKLNAYQYALNLVEMVYEMVALFPKEEKYALGDQLRRAIVSVPSNIVEGVGRDSDKEKAHFYKHGIYFSNGSDVSDRDCTSRPLYNRGHLFKDGE